MAGPVVFIASDAVGDGERELGEALMRSAIKTLAAVEPLPSALLMMNSGVKLCCEGSAALADLAKLADAGVEILNCGTCLDYYGLVDDLRVGEVSNMKEILERQAGASTVIRL